MASPDASQKCIRYYLVSGGQNCLSGGQRRLRGGRDNHLQQCGQNPGVKYCFSHLANPTKLYGSSWQVSGATVGAT